MFLDNFATLDPTDNEINLLQNIVNIILFEPTDLMLGIVDENYENDELRDTLTSSVLQVNIGKVKCVLKY